MVNKNVGEMGAVVSSRRHKRFLSSAIALFVCSHNAVQAETELQLIYSLPLCHLKNEGNNKLGLSAALRLWI